MRIAANPKAIAAETETVISIITEDHGVWKVFTGPNGLLEADIQGTLFIEMSTLQPATGRELVPLVEAKGARLIEFRCSALSRVYTKASCSHSPAGAPKISTEPAWCSTS